MLDRNNDDDFHDRNGHLSFDGLMIELDPGRHIGSFDGWFQFDDGSAIETIWVSGLIHGAAGFVEFDISKKNCGWLGNRLALALLSDPIYFHRMLEAVLARNPAPASCDPGPSQAQRL